jgi:hypothetical protein
MRRQRFMKLAGVAAMASALALVASAGGADAAPRGPGDELAAPTTTVPPRGPGDLAIEDTTVRIVTWCHGSLQCLVVKDLCAGIFIYDEVDGNGDPTHGYCDDSVESERGQVLVAKPASLGPGPVVGARCPEGTFLSPFEQPIYEGLFVVGYETVWYCLPDDLEPAG